MLFRSLTFSIRRKSELIQAILENVDSEENIGKELEEEKTDSKEANKHTKEDKQKSRNQDNDERIIASGLLEMHPDGYGFLRTNRYKPGDNDIYVSPVQIRRFNLKTGDYIEGYTREARESEKFSPLIFVESVNDDSPEYSINRSQFEDLTPIYPEEKLVLEKGNQDLEIGRAHV